MTKESGVTLKVGEMTNRSEFGRGIVRVDTRTMKELAIREGDYVELEGKRKTGAIAIRAYPVDVGLNVIRMDGITRRNTGVAVAETVKIRKAEVKEAKRVVIAPAQKGIMLQMNPEPVRKNLFMRPVHKGDLLMPFPVVKQRRSPFEDDMLKMFGFSGMSFNPMGTDTRFIVASTNPSGIVRVTEATELEIKPQAVEVEEDRAIPTITYEDLGGLKPAMEKIREMVELPLRHPELFTKLGIEPPKGVLLYGPPGTGKTLLAKAVANESGASFFSIAGPEIMNKFYGQSEENLRNIFEEAQKDAPSIIFIDEIDSIAPKREEVTGEVEKRVVSQLLSLMDGMKSRGKVIVIAATNRPDALDPALRRPGRFDREVEIGVPDAEGRKEVLQIHTRNMPIKHWNNEATSDVLNKKINDFEKTSHKIIETKREEMKDGKLVENNKNLIKRLENDILSIKKVKKVIEYDSKIIKKISKDINEIKNLIDIRETEDLRNKFSEMMLKENEKEIKNIERDLIEVGILSENLVDAVIRESVVRLIDEWAKITYGYVGADLEALTKEAAMSALRRALPNMDWKKVDELPDETKDNLKVTKEDFDNALKMVEPSAMREVMIEIPNVTWNDIGGLEEVKSLLKEVVEWPLEHPDAFKRMGIRPPSGVLLYGPPGSGKTLLAKAVAKEAGANFISIKGPEVFTKWVGESEKKIRDIFRRAKQVAPAIVFFDEIDAIAPHRGSDTGNRARDDVVSQILTEISGLEELHNVVVIAATNRPDIIDPALLRPGRFDRQIIVPVPDEKARLKIFEIYTGKMPVEKSLNIKKMAKDTAGYTGADIEAICTEAGLFALRKDIKAKIVTKADFEKALKKISPSVDSRLMDFYMQMDKQFKGPSAGGKKKKGDDEHAYIG